MSKLLRFLLLILVAGVFLPSGGARAQIAVGSVTLTHCAREYDGLCGSIVRPLDPAGRVPGTISIGFELYRHTDLSQPQLGTILAEEGGPGYSTTGSRDGYVRLFTPLRNRRDILLIDKRGTGKSGAIFCPGLQTGLQKGLAATRSCGWQLGDRAWLYSSTYAADDVAAVLQALGTGAVDYYGRQLRNVLRPGLRDAASRPGANHRAGQRLPNHRRDAVFRDRDRERPCRAGACMRPLPILRVTGAERHLALSGSSGRAPRAAGLRFRSWHQRHPAPRDRRCAVALRRVLQRRQQPDRLPGPGCGRACLSWRRRRAAVAAAGGRGRGGQCDRWKSDRVQRRAVRCGDLCRLPYALRHAGAGAGRGGGAIPRLAGGKAGHRSHGLCAVHAPGGGGRAWRSGIARYLHRLACCAELGASRHAGATRRPFPSCARARPVGRTGYRDLAEGRRADDGAVSGGLVRRRAQRRPRDGDRRWRRVRAALRLRPDPLRRPDHPRFRRIGRKSG